jgi:P4 family phage/plasmid primase-like protien
MELTDEEINALSNPSVDLKKLNAQRKVKEVDIFSRRGQLEEYYKHQPFFYDKSKNFWIWDKENFYWKITDEIDFLNGIQEKLGIETINSQIRSELLAGFQQVGRKHTPKPAKKTWVQFKDLIYDIETDEIIVASPQHLITNPIKYQVGTSDETPTIEKYFVEWVGEEHKQELYELIAYSICPNRFLQRMFALCGSGANGKGTFMKIVQKFIGSDNYVSTELRQISENQFETATLFKKLLAVMGEVSESDLKNTNTIKELSGEDKIRYCFKGKTPFTDENTCLCVCLTNNLPTTPDKSLGFYRRWHIIDFPNQFNQISKDFVGEISEQEFENLAAKCLKTLKNLYSTGKMTNEGNFIEREKRYEERSNPLERFIQENCDEEPENKITLRNFVNAYNDTMRKHHLKTHTAISLSKKLRELGYYLGNRIELGVSSRYILGISFKKNSENDQNNNENNGNITFSNHSLYGKSFSDSNISDISTIFSKMNKRDKINSIYNILKEKKEDLTSLQISELFHNQLGVFETEQLLDIMHKEGIILQINNKWKVL